MSKENTLITLRKIIGGRYYLTAYDNEEQEIATIKEFKRTLDIEYYYTQKTIYGILSELGGKSITTPNKHILIDGFSHRVYLDKEQDLELKQFYGTDKLRVKIRLKRSSVDSHIIRAEMISFLKIGDGMLHENIEKEGYVDLAILKGAKTIDDVLNRIYGG